VELATIEAAIGALNPTERKHAPARLWLAGDASLLRQHPRVAIVGTRTPTADGIRRTKQLVSQLVRHRAIIDLPAAIALVDDIVTRGAEAMGAAQAIWKVWPDVNISFFAVMRTESDPDTFRRLLDPIRGHIEMRHGDAFGRP
jgi:hypothetical protein